MFAEFIQKNRLNEENPRFRGLQRIDEHRLADRSLGGLRREGEQAAN